jgi:hypothetical protein
VRVTVENGVVTEVRGHGVAIPSSKPPPVPVESSVPVAGEPASTPAAGQPSPSEPGGAAPPAKEAAPAKAKTAGKGKAPGAEAASAPPPEPKPEPKSPYVKWIVAGVMVVIALWIRGGNKRAPVVPAR